MALDERRAKFKVTLWNRPHKSQPTFGVEEQEFESKEDHTEPKLVQDQPINTLKTMERQYSLKSWQETDIEEVYFLFFLKRVVNKDVAVGLVCWMSLR